MLVHIWVCPERTRDMSDIELKRSHMGWFYVGYMVYHVTRKMPFVDQFYVGHYVSLLAEVLANTSISY